MCKKTMDFDAAKEEFTAYLDGAEASILSYCRRATKHEDMCIAAQAMLILSLQDVLIHLSATRVELHAWYDTYARGDETPMEVLVVHEKKRISQVMMQYGLSLNMGILS